MSIKAIDKAFVANTYNRFDLQIEVPPVDYEQLSSYRPSESSAAIRERVCAAREKQLARQAETGVLTNAQLPPKSLRELCRLTPQAAELLKTAFEKLDLSARGYDRILRLARTIADLEGSETITEAHLSEAVCLRSVDRRYW